MNFFPLVAVLVLLLPAASPPASRGLSQFVFSFGEVADARWNPDISATLYSELPRHLVLGDPEAVREWRFPPHVTPAATARGAGLIEGCAWVSRDAQRVLIAGDRAAPSVGGTAAR